jgi:diacylglycerol kinase
MIQLKLFYRSLSHAVRGVLVVFRSEQSFRIQLFAGVVVIALAGWFSVRWFEWVVLLLLIGFVLSMELINSIFERIVDTVKPRIHPVVRDIKDMMAAAVLIASVFSIVIGFTIFWPYLTTLVLR